MTATFAEIVGRFYMELPTKTPDRDAWFLDYVLRSPKDAGRHLTAGWLALNSLKEVYQGDEIKSCLETFGGMGAQALMAQKLFNLETHIVREFNTDAVHHLERALTYRHRVQVGHADAYNTPPPPADLVVLDFGDLTCWKTRDGEQHRRLLDQVFDTEPKAVVFTDIACRYLHLHRQRYEGLLGPNTCVDYPTYLRALLVRLQAMYGYELQRGYYDRWSAVMALVPEENSTSGQLLPTPAEPAGLELF